MAFISSTAAFDYRLAACQHRRRATARFAATASAAAPSSQGQVPAASQQEGQPHELPPAARLMGAANAFMLTQAVHAAAKLRVADALAAGPLPVAELAAAVGAKAEHLRRTLRLLVLLGIFEETKPGVFTNNDASALLAASSPASRRDLVMHLGDESYWGWTKMPDSLLLGQPDTAILSATGGLDYWQWLDQPENHEASARFNRAMTESSTASLPSILQDYNWSQHASATVTDVGGGVGGVLAGLLRTYPGMRGILFDRPPVIEEAAAEWPQLHPDLSGRVELVGGDFFESAPQADVYFLKHILHDWSDEDAVKILKTLRQAATPQARLLLCEYAVDDWDLVKACLDLQMMALAGGKERTGEDWRALLAAGGFELQEVVPLSVGLSIVVGRPA